jgi:anti-sigma factor RsiW
MSNDTHDYCWKMLPWFVTGRLSASDLQRLERHLEDCSACRAELAEQRELCGHIRRDEPLMLAPQSSLQKMMARIDSAESGSGDLDTAPDITRLDVPTNVVADFPAARPAKPRSYRWLAVAAAVQTFAIAFLLTLVVRQTSEEMTAPRFSTLSSPGTASADGALLRVVFNPETSAAQVQTLLRSVGAQVVAGPTEAGVYTLRLERKPDESAVAQALSQVRADGSVVFAEHVSVERKP